MVLILYGFPGSPPVRAVRMTAQALDLEMEFKIVDLKKGEHLTPEFLKMNPQHTVPTLDDDGFYIWDGQVICTYLIRKYAEDDCLYPKDFQCRALVDQRLHFNNSIMFTRLRAVFYPVLYMGKTTLPQEVWDDLTAAYEFLEAFLQDKEWMAGNFMTVADICLFASVTSTDVVHPIDSDKFPNLIEWLNKCKELPYNEINEEGVNAIRELWKVKYTA